MHVSIPQMASTFPYCLRHWLGYQPHDRYPVCLGAAASSTVSTVLAEERVIMWAIPG